MIEDKEEVVRDMEASFIESLLRQQQRLYTITQQCAAMQGSV
jgi:hypothetical protein